VLFFHIVFDLLVELPVLFICLCFLYHVVLILVELLMMWSEDSTGRHHITRCSRAFDMHSFHIHVDA
jgi:hypothetical protein